MQPTEKTKILSIKTECRKLLALPCIKAIFSGLLAQFFFLSIFIFCVNFNLLHPIRWLLELFGFHWIKHIPLFGILLAIGLSLSKSFFIDNKYYPNRFKWLLDNGLRKLILLAFQMLLGTLTSWSFMSYLRTSDGSLLKEINGTTCLNSHYIFLTFVGLTAGFYNFLHNFARRDVTLELQYIPKPIFIRMRENFLDSLCSSARKSCMPTIGFTLVYWLIGGLINRRIAYVFNVATDEQFNTLFHLFTSLNILFYAWLIITEVFTVMNFMQRSFSIFITTDYEFPISNNDFIEAQVTLIAVLSMQDFPTLQKLAALDFYNLAKMNTNARRSEIFALSQPGGHPYNWNQLSGQCLAVINNFIDKLNVSLKLTPAILPTTTSTLFLHDNLHHSKSTELAQRILIQQYNEKHNIRRLKSDLQNVDQNLTSSTVSRINANFEQTVQKIKQVFLGIFKSVPGLYYMFGEPENAQISYLLSNTDLLIWIIEGLTYICAASLTEDPYGIVQLTLPEIIKTFLKLKIELDKLSSLNLCSKKVDPNLMPLRNALKRSLFKICNAFSAYLPEIVEDINDLPFLRTFIYKC